MLVSLEGLQIKEIQRLIDGEQFIGRPYWIFPPGASFFLRLENWSLLYHFVNLLGNFRAKANIKCTPTATSLALYNKVSADAYIFVFFLHSPLPYMIRHDHGGVSFPFLNFFFPPILLLIFSLRSFLTFFPSQQPGLCHSRDYH